MSYTRFLEEGKEAKEKEERGKKRKQEVEELEALKEKAKRLKKDIDVLTTNSKQLADKCETTGNLTFVTKSNSFRRTAGDKLKELKTLEDTISQKQSEIKQ